MADTKLSALSAITSVDANDELYVNQADAYGVGASKKVTYANLRKSIVGAGDLATEILADAPVGYWMCNETSGGICRDYSGNAYHGTYSGTVSYAHSGLVPAYPNDKYVQIGATNGQISFGLIGQTFPLTGSWTVEAVANLNSTTGYLIMFAAGVTGETEATNFQMQVAAAASTSQSVLYAYWESGAGTDRISNSTVYIRPGQTYHIAVSKDATNKFVNFYINGVRVTKLAYTTEPTGGSSVSNFTVGYDNNTNTGTFLIGQLAYFSSELTPTRIYAHAVAAGLAG